MPGSLQCAVGLDAGSYGTRVAVCGLEGRQIRFLGYGEVASTGWFKGRVADPAALTASIQAAAHEAYRLAQVPVEEVVVGLGGVTVHGDNEHGTYEFGRPREIRPEDMEYAIRQAARKRSQEGRVLVHVFPQDFILDGRAGYRNPRGATCARLDANVHIVTAATQDYQCLLSAVHQAQLEVEAAVFEPVAAAYAGILAEDRRRGVALVDIGMHSTEIIIYDGDALVLSRSLPICADHFTRDVASRLTVSYTDAEDLKKEYGCAILGLTSDNSVVALPSSAGRLPREIQRRTLNEILEARAEELFLYVGGQIVGAGMEQSLLEGVVLTGGGALLNGMCDMAERVLNCQARNGLPIGIKDWPPELDNPSWTTAAGLAMFSARLKLDGDRKRRPPGFLGLFWR